MPVRIFYIFDIYSFCIYTVELLEGVCKEYNIPLSDMDLIVDWLVNQLLIDVYSIKVVHHYRHDLYKCIYTEFYSSIRPHFIRCMNKDDLHRLQFLEVKTLIAGKDLFITNRTPL